MLAARIFLLLHHTVLIAAANVQINGPEAMIELHGEDGTICQLTAGNGQLQTSCAMAPPPPTPPSPPPPLPPLRTQSIELPGPYSRISLYVDNPADRRLSTVLASAVPRVGATIYTMQGGLDSTQPFYKSTFNSSGEWEGTLTEILPGLGYALHNVYGTLTYAAPAVVLPMRILFRPGWTYFACPYDRPVLLSQVMTVEDGSFEDKDTIKTDKWFTKYFDVSNFKGWVGQLEYLEPGLLHQFKRVGTTSVTVVFNELDYLSPSSPPPPPAPPPLPPGP